MKNNRDFDQKGSSKVVACKQDDITRKFVQHFLQLAGPYRESLTSLATAYDLLSSSDGRAAIFEQMYWLSNRSMASERAVPIDEIKECDQVEADIYRRGIGKRVSQIRSRLGWTQETLAKNAKMQQSHISRIEAGKFTPTYLTIEKIAKALNVKCSEIDLGYLEE